MHEDGIRKIRKKLKLTYFDLVCLLTARNVLNNRETARSWVEKDEECWNRMVQSREDGLKE